jgi:hypothetical protein
LDKSGQIIAKKVEKIASVYEKTLAHVDTVLAFGNAFQDPDQGSIL